MVDAVLGVCEGDFELLRVGREVVGVEHFRRSVKTHTAFFNQVIAELQIRSSANIRRIVDKQILTNGAYTSISLAVVPESAVDRSLVNVEHPIPPGR